MTKKLKRCAIYIRVSTAEQMMHGKSLEAQKEYLTNYANDHDMVVVGIYADEGKTARKELKKRKAVHNLLEDVKAGKIDVIIFWRIDRWFRNLADFYKVQDILDENNVHWISTSEPGINMETRDGRLQLNVVLSIGQNEVDTTSERIKFVNEASIRQKKLIFGDVNMGYGYKSDFVDGVKRMVKDPDREDTVNAFYDYYMKHQSKCAALRYIQNNYDPDFSWASMRTLLSSEFYKGTYRGFPYCPAYLTEKQWNCIQEISCRNVKKTPSGRIYLFTSLMHCPVCGNILCGTGSSSIINRKTGAKKTYCYYRCNKAIIDRRCSYRHRISQNLIETYLLNNLEDEYQKYKLRCEKIEKEQKKKKKTQTPEKLQKELERLNVLYQKGRIEWEYYNNEYDRIQDELNKLLNTPPEQNHDYSELEDLLNSDFKTMYLKLTPENRRAFWRSTIKQIYLNENGSIKSVDFL